MFPLFEFVFPAFSILPVEMIAMILRNLDSESLLNAAISNKYFMKICRGDPILRERICLQVKIEKELRLQAILDAKRGIAVLRDGPSKMFNPNVQKTIKREKVKPITMQTSYEVPSMERRKGGGKLQQRRNKRVEPYKTFRC